MLFIITGASKGLGCELSKIALKNRHDVLGVSRSCSIHSNSYQHSYTDLSNIDELQLLCSNINRIISIYKKVVLVNNAATIGKIDSIGNLEQDAIVLACNLNFLAPFFISKSLVKSLENNEYELMIVNISSGAASKAIDGWSLYCTTKSALKMLGDVIEAESFLNSRKNIRVLLIDPGVIDTKMQDTLRDSSKSHFSKQELFVSYKEQGTLKSPVDAALEVYTKIIGSYE